jgi:hypothetical protein
MPLLSSPYIVLIKSLEKSYTEIFLERMLDNEVAVGKGLELIFIPMPI